ncbi:uncharacterized protein LOC110431697 [Sorghum bicolor]|uniref:uncharacterized protein LOC110431697 n=1 Tax=Sorghum bicolor TaxID=4558 RepID=UPI000B4242BF|nr:uncharacterized protein LOC110431697 [Sorghum bicolor]|eukprot:XP_021306732.1 uncharacterized protein LOC110431697 [Sorghum bicolor]
MDAVESHDDYFVQKKNCTWTFELSYFQKVTTALRMITYEVSTDATDEYIRIGESTALESLRKFVAAVVELFEAEYLRHPTEADIARSLAVKEKRGSHNDINVLHQSPLFDNLAEGKAPKVHYTINGHDYKMGYLLADDIYPSWATLVKSISSPMGNKQKYFATTQEAARKDIERFFGVFQSKFAIIRQPGRIWDRETLVLIVRACVIMHHMIVKDERVVDPDERFSDVCENVQPSHGKPTRTLAEFIEAHNKKIRDKPTHFQLKEDLIEHL